MRAVSARTLRECACRSRRSLTSAAKNEGNAAEKSSFPWLRALGGAVAVGSVPWFYAYHYRHNADLRDAVAEARAGEGGVLGPILISATDNAAALGLELEPIRIGGWFWIHF